MIFSTRSYNIDNIMLVKVFSFYSIITKLVAYMDINNL